MRSRPSTLGLVVLVPALSLNLFGNCGGGGGGGGNPVTNTTTLEFEPNDTGDFATTIYAGRPVRGDLLELGDQDWFIVRLFAGHTIQIELFATRRDQAAWDAAGTVPRITMSYPFSDTKVLEHSFTDGWAFGAQDFEVPSYRLTTTGFFWIRVAPDNELASGGSYVLRVRYADSASNQLELESRVDIGGNDTSGTAQRISPGTVNGYHRDGNEDFYSIAVAGPSVVRLEVLAARNGAQFAETSYFDPVLSLFDADGTTLLAQNDDTFLADPGIQFEVASAGIYTFDVSQSPASTASGYYKLLVSTSAASGTPETEPNDTFATADPTGYGLNVSGSIAPGQEDWFRYSGTAGDMVRLQAFDGQNSLSASEAVAVTLVGADGLTPLPFHVGPQFQVLTAILRQSGNFFVRVQSGAGVVDPTSYRLELRRFRATTYESEPNDSIAQAPAFPGGGFASGTIGSAGDRDTYRFTATSDLLVVFDVFASSAATGSDQLSEFSGHGSALAPLITIRDVNGVALASSTSIPVNGIFTEALSDGLPSAAIAFVAPPTSHVFYVEVAAADGTAGADHVYVIQRR